MQKNIDNHGPISREASPNQDLCGHLNLPRRPETQLQSRTFDRRTPEDVYLPVRNRSSAHTDQNRFRPSSMLSEQTRSAKSDTTTNSKRDPRKVRAVEDSLKALQDKVADLKSKLRQVEDFSNTSRIEDESVHTTSKLDYRRSVP